MNHQAGQEGDGANASAADSTPADAAVAENEDGHATGAEGPADADSDAGESADHEVAVAGAEPARLETGEPADHEVAVAAAEPARPETGEPRVDAALTLLDRLTELPVTEHAAVLEQVHAELTAVLGQLDPESAGADD